MATFMVDSRRTIILDVRVPSVPVAELGGSIMDRIRSFKEIIDGKHDDLPENAFYMVGSIEDAVAKAKAE